MALPLDEEDGDDGDELACCRCEAATAGVVGIVDVDVDVEAGTACDGLRGVLLGAMAFVCSRCDPEGPLQRDGRGQGDQLPGWLSLSRFSLPPPQAAPYIASPSIMLSAASTSAPRTALCSCLRRLSAPAALVQARAVHTRPNLPYDIRQGCRPFLSEQAVKGTAIDWHQGNLNRLNDLIRGEGPQASRRAAVCANERAHTGNFGLAIACIARQGGWVQHS